MASLLDTIDTEFWVISAGKGKRRMYFAGHGFTIYRDRALHYRSRESASEAMKNVAAGYRRPGMRIEKIEASDV